MRTRVDWGRHGDDGAALFGPLCVTCPVLVWCTPGSDGSSENVTSIAQHVQRRDQQGGVVPRVGTGRCVPVRDDVESAFARASNQRRVTTPARLNGPWWGPLGRAIPR